MKRYIKAAIKSMSEEDLDTQRRIASDPNTRTEVLRSMADTNEYFIQLDLAANPHTPTDILDQFTDFRKYSSHVRGAVAANPSTPRDTLYKLITLGDPIVYRALADNPNTPIDLLDVIAHRQSSEFSNFATAQAAVARNQMLPERCLFICRLLRISMSGPG